MQYDRDEQLVFVRWGRLPRPLAQPRPRRDERSHERWRWRWRPAPRPPRRLAPGPVPPEPLDIHEYLELEFAVGEESRR
jgi:hypothetical protein